jgi:hypothetical protein
MVAGLWCLLGGWVGALLFFGVVVAPTTFQALPSPELAGKIVGPVLRSLNLYGMAAGPALAFLAWRLRRGKLLVALPLILSLAAVVSEFGIASAIQSIRPLAFGPEPDAAALLRFGQLHRIAVDLFTLTGILALLLALLHAWADVSARRTGEKSGKSVSL